MDQRTALISASRSHQPWCTHHADGGHHTDQLCLRPIPTPVGTLLLSHREDDGTLLDLTTIPSEITLAQAAQVRDALDGLLAGLAVAA
ncbi:hypothetical protein ABT340_35645 [Streptosporangium sp. NPDC000239]|uniref:hypothetical protein n=1 Tax=Streptosporangium sp. NPDC000239 TaxID=3154248 RepID=UPI00333061CB